MFWVLWFFICILKVIVFFWMLLLFLFLLRWMLVFFCLISVELLVWVIRLCFIFILFIKVRDMLCLLLFVMFIMLLWMLLEFEGLMVLEKSMFVVKG